MLKNLMALLFRQSSKNKLLKTGLKQMQQKIQKIIN